MQLKVKLNLHAPRVSTIQKIAEAFSKVAKEFQILILDSWHVFVIFTPKKKIINIKEYLDELHQRINSEQFGKEIYLELEGIKYEEEDVDSLLTLKVCKEIKGGEQS